MQNQRQVSPQRGLPVEIMKNSSQATPVTNETVQLYYNNSGALTADAGQAAGVVVMGFLQYDQILNKTNTALAMFGDTSLAFTSLDLTTEVGVISYINFEEYDALPWPKRMALIGALLSNGQYVVDYRFGVIYGKKASNGTSLTATSYYVRKGATASSSSSGSSVGGGNNIWSNPQDFTATANAGAKTITLSGFTSTVLSAVLVTAHFSNAVIKKITSTGVVSSLPTTSVAYVAGTGVLTLADMTANFAAGDTVVVMIPGPDKSYDETYDFNRTGDQFAPQYEDNTLGVAYGMRRPVSSATSADSSDVSAAAEASSVTKATPGRVYSIDFMNGNAAPRYFQLFNSATVPADTAVPVLSVYVPAGQSVHMAWENGLYFSTGIAWANSSTGATKTVGAADSLANVLYA